MSWWNRVSNLLRREDLGRELDEELQFHIDSRIRDNLKAGMTEEAARTDARRSAAVGPACFQDGARGLVLLDTRCPCGHIYVSLCFCLTLR